MLSDQDDVWLDGKVAIIRARFARPPAPIYLIVLDGMVVDEAGTVTDDSIFAKIRSGPGVLKNLYDNTYLGCCMAFSRELLDVALPSRATSPCTTCWLGQLAQLLGAVDFVSVKTIKYRKHASSTTGFERRFIPITQVRRRWALASNLAKRWIFAGGEPLSAEGGLEERQGIGKSQDTACPSAGLTSGASETRSGAKMAQRSGGHGTSSSPRPRAEGSGEVLR